MEAVELAGRIHFGAFWHRERYGHVSSVRPTLVGYTDDLSQGLTRWAVLGHGVDGNRLRVCAGWQPKQGTPDHHRASEKPN